MAFIYAMERSYRSAKLQEEPCGPLVQARPIALRNSGSALLPRDPTRIDGGVLTPSEGKAGAWRELPPPTAKAASSTSNRSRSRDKTSDTIGHLVCFLCPREGSRHT